MAIMRAANNVLLFLSIGFVLTTVQANPAWKLSNRAACPESYAPCTCDLTANGLEIACIDVTIAEIRSVFFRTQTLVVHSVTLTASDPVTVDLPADLLSDKRSQKIFLNCPPKASPNVLLTINPLTFEYSRINTTQFEINDCDLVQQTDFLFLNGFNVLSSLKIGNSLNIEGFATLPNARFPALKELAIFGSTGLENIAFPDLTPARLERLDLSGNALVDTVANSILVSIGSSSSVSSLKEINLARNELSKIPRIASFSQLVSYDLSDNTIAFISLSSLIFVSPVTFVGLTNVGLTAIEGGAFQGDYTKAQVNLEQNSLTEFRSEVFKSMLDQMAAQPFGVGGQLIVTGNPFNCGCGLAWLIRDNPNLVPSVKNGVCGGFFKFEDLNPDSFVNCA